MHGKGSMCGGGHAWLRACMARRFAWQGDVHGRGVCVAAEMATAADGTLPTGIHSCLKFNAQDIRAPVTVVVDLKRINTTHDGSTKVKLFNNGQSNIGPQKKYKTIIMTC